MTDLKKCIDRYHFMLTLADLKIMTDRNDEGKNSFNDTLYMNLIFYIPNCTVSILSEILNIAKSSATVKVNELCEKGFIIKTKDPDDGRVYRLKLSEGMSPMYYDEDNSLAKGIIGIENKYSEEEIESFCKILSELSNSLNNG